MELDVLGLYAACSYALDCVEAELVHVKSDHAKRVAYMSVCTAEQLGIADESLSDLAVCALLHDNALTQYIQEEFNNKITHASDAHATQSLGRHCLYGEGNIQKLTFHTDVSGAILYHHENADGSGPFGKRWDEIPVFSRIIHLCDMLDVMCRTKSFTEETWAKTQGFLNDISGSIVDESCIAAFRSAFPKEHFLTLGDPDIDKRLWSKAPRIKQELDFEQIKSIADFFADVVDYKSSFTSTHSMEVAETAEALANFAGLDKETSEKLYLAGALHDIGKVAVGNNILEKPGRLTDDEFDEMKDHATYTYRILSGIEDFEELRDWAAFHHERLDGSGYPFGKTASDLGVEERIVACADVYQALTEKRPYKDGMKHDKAMEILRDMAGRGWLDAELVEMVDRCFG